MDLDLSAKRGDPIPGYARRLGSLRRLCLALAGTMVLLAGLSWLLAQQAAERAARLPGALPLTLSVLAAVLILLSSRLRSTLLRRAFPRSAVLTADPETMLAAYQKATRISFAVLAAAGLLGVLVALTSASAVYGVVLCGASAFAMLTRWPRAVEVDRLIRGRARP